MKQRQSWNKARTTQGIWCKAASILLPSVKISIPIKGLSNQCHIQCPINVIPCASQPHSPLLLQNRASFSPSSPLLNPVSFPVFDDPMASLFIPQFHSSLTSSTPIHPPTEPSHHSELLFLWNLKLQYPTMTTISYSQFYLLNIHSLSFEVTIQLHWQPPTYLPSFSTESYWEYTLSWWD